MLDILRDYLTTLAIGTMPTASVATRTGDPADAESNVPSVENPELTNVLPLKPGVE